MFLAHQIIQTGNVDATSKYQEFMKKEGMKLDLIKVSKNTRSTQMMVGGAVCVGIVACAFGMKLLNQKSNRNAD